MRLTSCQIAERASFEAFVNCYLHELGAGDWHSSAEWLARMDPGWSGRGPFVVDLALPRQGLRLALEITYRSSIGRHRVGLVRVQRTPRTWRGGDRLEVMLTLIRELYSSAQSPRRETLPQELELVMRVVQSQQIMARYIDARAHDGLLHSDRFIDSEQSLLYGHWCHPTPKSRQGMADFQHESFAPELRGRFRLHHFAVARELVQQQSVVGASAEDLIAQAVATDELAASMIATARARDEVVVPVHPLQAEWLLHQPHVRRWVKEGLVRNAGAFGPEFTATSSVRTVYHEDCAWMFKLSIPVKITNSLRVNRRHELAAGLVMAELLQKLGSAATTIRVLADPAFLTVEAPGLPESGFELLIRENPFRRGRDRGVHSVAALVQAPLPHRPSRLRSLIEGLALTEGRSVEAVSAGWFVRYLTCAVAPLLRLYDEHGIALEAHQQNSLLDLRAGYPRAYYFRDNQGYYLSSQHRERLIGLTAKLTDMPELFFDDALIERRFSYYLIKNQLFSVIQRLGSDGLLAEEIALGAVKSLLGELASELRGPGGALVRGLLSRERLPCKANLLTRLHDVDELLADCEQAHYVEVHNPLCNAAATGSLELEVA